MPYINLLNHTFIYVQQAPSVATHASFVSPEIVASSIIQSKAGGITKRVRNIIIRVNPALNELLFIFCIFSNLLFGNTEK